MRFVFLSEGDLFLQEDGRAPVEIESQFAREAIDRMSSRSERMGWKGRGREGDGMHGAQMVWGRQAANSEQDHPVVRAIARGAADGELLYTLNMSASSGLFRYNLGTKDELRLFHREDFDGSGLACHSATGRILLSTRKEHLGKLELYDEAARRRRQLTDGDSHDSNPSLDPASADIVYFQSSGVARNEDGHVVAFGPSAIHKLDCASGEMTTLKEDDHWDYLQPRADAQGNLLYIRRPFRRDDLSFWQKLKAFVLVPYHLASAIFAFADAFSRFFNKQSLRPAGSARELPYARSRYATFRDTTIALEKVLGKRGQIDDRVQVVPDTWQLIREDRDGNETTLADHVVAFDLGPNGELIYSDGIRVWEAGATPKKLFQGKIIQSVAIV